MLWTLALPPRGGSPAQVLHGFRPMRAAFCDGTVAVDAVLPARAAPQIGMVAVYFVWVPPRAVRGCATAALAWQGSVSELRMCKSRDSPPRRVG